jgi:hypothetical protein
MPDLSETAYIPADMNWRVLTPSQAARTIAAANEHLSPALIVVRSWTPKGSEGRRGWGYRHNTFVMVGGKANPLKFRRSYGAGAPGERVEIRHNGGCQVCGEIHADYALTWAQAPDGWVLACGACAQANLLHVQNVVSPFYWQGVGKSGISSLCEYAEPAYAYRIFVDLTTGGDVEVAGYAETLEAQEAIEDGITALRAWVREHSRMPSLEEAAVTLAFDSGDQHPAAVLRSEKRRIGNVLSRLGEFETFNGLMAFVRQTKNGGER